MSNNKNIFSSLNLFEQDDKQVEEKKTVTKKVHYENNKVLREAHGTEVQKNDNRKEHNQNPTNQNRFKPRREERKPRAEGEAHPDNKDRPVRQKREFERHSGTGKPAFKKNDFKKDGHGKGNVGNLIEDAKDQIDAHRKVHGEQQKFDAEDIVIRRVKKN